MKLVFDPPFSPSNEYSGIISKYLISHGYVVYSLAELFSSIKLFMSVKIVHLNWFETFGTYGSFIKKLAKLILLILFRKKIVWTMHNKTPHEKNLKRLNNLILFILVKTSSRIIIHCRESEKILLACYKINKDKIIYIPHPNYIDVYGSILERNIEPLHNLHLLFLGAIKPYKNIELLIEVANNFQNKINLHIAGNPSSAEYGNEIKRMAQNNRNITFDLRFIENDQMISLLSDCDLVILPYDLRSSLNSGTIILCFSYAKSVITPEIGTIGDIKDKSCILSYTYDNEQDHYKKIVEKILVAIEKKQQDPEIFQKWGREMFSYVNENNDIQSVQFQFRKMYESL